MLLKSVLPIGPPGYLLAVDAGSIQPIFELQTGPTDFLVLLGVEASVGNNNAGPSAFAVGLGVPTVKGIGILSAAIMADDTTLTNALAGCLFFTQWTKQPTAPTNYLRRMVTNPAAGAGNVRGPRSLFYFDFPNGLKIQPSSSLVLFVTNSTVNFGAVYSDITLTVDD